MNDWPFTPEIDTGGWQVSSDAEGLRTFYVIEDDAYDLGAEWAPQDERIAANVNLIAAAPRMYRAAKKIIARWEHGDLAEAVRDLSAAIDWIDGRQ